MNGGHLQRCPLFSIALAFNLLEASHMPHTANRSFTSRSIIIMTTSSVSPSVVFVVLFGRGEYEDYTQSVCRTFTDRNAASLFVARKNDAIQRVVGMSAALEKFLKVWDKEHPAPPSRYGENSDDWSEEAEEAHRVARCEEEDRLSHILGLDEEWEALKLSRWDGRSANYFYVESKLDGDWYTDD